MLTVSRHGRELRFPLPDDATEDPWVYRPLRKGRVYEESFLEHVRQQAQAGTYVDVGAHLGTHTAWFAMLCPSDEVHAVEPVVRFADHLDRVVEANDLGGRVTVHRIGLSDATGHATNTLSPPHQVGFDVPGNARARDETFEVTTLDELAIRHPVAVIKIDVEGMEDKVLLGSRETLRNDKPIVYAECWNREKLDSVTNVLRPFGYRATGEVFNATPTYEFEVIGPLADAVRRARRAIARLYNKARSTASTVLPRRAGWRRRLRRSR